MAKLKADKIFNVLFLCTGNSARSIMAECILNRIGKGKFSAFSAGSQPKGSIHPVTLRILQENNFLTDGLRSKEWNEFSGPGAVHLDFVFTVCDRAAREPCPVWPGQPLSAHWGFEDPAVFQGSEDEQEKKFHQIFIELMTRISLFVNLPFSSLDRLALQERLDEMGKRREASAESSYS